ncbi:hypothetical protein F4780DRAFT_422170 [Xylariomycetidae sp. FL0641]|nr:hypothetical protein F4780DRAFT_422170 [Xylariomycetidae sp. FL0641]
MYSPYGSYSSLSTPTAPLDIAQGSYLAASNHTSSASYNCAYPSWPRSGERATSYVSDDDLFLCDEEDARSVASSSSSYSAAPTSPFAVANEEEILEMQAQKMARQREAMRFLVAEKERRRQQSQRKRRSSSGSSSSSPSSKKSPKSRNADHMSAIEEDEVAVE